MKEYSKELELDWNTEAIVSRREKYYAATQRAFVPYKNPLIFNRGLGEYLWDEHDRRYIDLLAMNVCVSVGHAHPEVTQAVAQQAGQLQHCTTMFYHPVPAHYAEELVATMPSGYDWVVHFTNSGAEAIDLALLMARSHTGNIDFISLRTAYHGATFGAQALTGISAFRHNVPQLPGIKFVAEPNTFRGVYGEKVEPYLDEIEQVIQLETNGALAGIIIEPVQGEAGVFEVDKDFLKSLRELCDENETLLIMDEVQSGIGRMGYLFGYMKYDIEPDILTSAKSKYIWPFSILSTYR